MDSQKGALFCTNQPASQPASRDAKMSEVIQTGACPLIDALPVEIRIQIYESILFENGSFFSLDDEEGNSVPTLFPKLRAPPKRTDQQPVVEDGDPQGTGPGRGTGNIMALLLSNKQM